MSIAVLINNSDKPAYITWSPMPCKLKTDRKKREVILRNKSSNQHGRVLFLTADNSPPKEELKLKLKGDGKALSLCIAGCFDHNTGQAHASMADMDTHIELVDTMTGSVLDEKALMVRIRKNANELSPAERDRFLSALVKLHKSGRFDVYRSMHTLQTSPEIHGRSCFLVWHRAFLLDVERRLQEIDPAVSLPYWKFGEAAPNVFSPDFMGVPDASGMVDYSAGNPLINWLPKMRGACGSRVRRAYAAGAWNPAARGAPEAQCGEEHAMNLGNSFAAFKTVEDDPRGGAHISFTGHLSELSTAAADPLFLLLHCNVDRLWARWQWLGNNFNPGHVRSYPNQGSGEAPVGDEGGAGNFTRDTMWPWNGVTGAPRPESGPGGAFPDSHMTRKPGRNPKVSDMIDYQGQCKPAANLNYAYNDVPYDFEN